ncbi:MAG: GatB/YqeY domain-containing protein [Hyphomicrobiaceae bacterium]
MRDRINQNVKDAMKSGDKLRLSTLRLVQAAIKDRDIAARVDAKGQSTGKERVEDAEILALLQKMIKQRRESAETYTRGGRLDLAEKENAEIVIIEEFMPQQMDEAEMNAACSAVMEEIGFSGLKDMGKTMAALKQRYAGQMDFGKASAFVKSKC